MLGILQYRETAWRTALTNVAKQQVGLSREDRRSDDVRRLVYEVKSQKLRSIWGPLSLERFGFLLREGGRILNGDDA